MENIVVPQCFNQSGKDEDTTDMKVLFTSVPDIGTTLNYIYWTTACQLDTGMFNLINLPKSEIPPKLVKHAGN